MKKGRFYLFQTYARAIATPAPKVDIQKRSVSLRSRIIHEWSKGDVAIDRAERRPVTIILPVRLMDVSVDEDLNRIIRIVQTIPSDLYEVLIVDDGSSCDNYEKLCSIAIENSVGIIRTDGCGGEFSIGRARDFGAMHSRTRFILFHDIDFLMDSRSYRCLLEELDFHHMWHNPFCFFAVPGAYLSQQYSDVYIEAISNGNIDQADLQVLEAVRKKDKSKVINFTMAISAIMVDRRFFIAMGGHDKSFVGHGAEDFELMHRLAQYDPRPPLPRGYNVNLRSNQTSLYLGFRAYFAKYGKPLFERGLCFKHIWHPPRGEVGYYANKNQEIISDALLRWLD